MVLDQTVRHAMLLSRAMCDNPIDVYAFGDEKVDHRYGPEHPAGTRLCGFLVAGKNASLDPS